MAERLLARISFRAFSKRAARSSGAMGFTPAVMGCKVRIESGTPLD
jgi:hypothetical protein